MSKTCTVKFNDEMKRWEAVASDGYIVASTRDTEGGVAYLKGVIEGGLSRRAQARGITKCIVIEGDNPLQIQSALPVPAAVRVIENEFPINERFAIMEDYVDMVAKRELCSALVTGDGGLGKTFTVMRGLKNSGLQDISKMEIGTRMDVSGPRGYVVVKGYSTAKGLFRTLYENRRQVIVFDDCDAVLTDPNSVNILKAALDSYETRMVSWNAEGWGGDDDLPRVFEFTGAVIFISNKPKHKIPQALRSRAMCADVSMTRDEVIDRMRVIIKSDEFLPDFEMEHKLDAMEFVAEHAHNPMITELNLRSLVNVVKARAAKPNTWKRLGLYSMANT